ncbi:FHA domain-containing protein [Roseiflexus sp.]|uniref:FHA domain-containing protein n=1 Tax=Roseiflexus sp. TaxID=2562120 RepID=UPI00398A9279
MTSRLVCIRGPLMGREFDLGDQPFALGRAADNHIIIASPRASRHHAQIRREGAAFVLYDLGSGNGTLVNGQRIQRALLQPGDLIDIGDEVFRFEAASQQDATVLSPPASAPHPYASQPPSSPPYPSAPQQAHPPGSYPQPAAPHTPVPGATPYPPQAPAAYPPQAPAAYPPQAPAAYPPQMPPAGHLPAYASPPPRAKSGGQSCFLVVVLLLILVCAAGAAGAYVFRDRLPILPGIDRLPGNLPTMTRPPVQTGSAIVGSGQAAAISMPGGPMIEVPVGAVPPNPDGSPSTLTFSVAPAPYQSVNLPDDMALSGDLYQFEPDGVTFAAPVRITLPIPAGTDPSRVMGLITRDPQSGAWAPVAGTVNAAERTVSAEVTHFSPYGVYSYTGSDLDAWHRAHGGWFILDNQIVRGSGTYPGCRNLPSTLYVNVCIQQATLVNPGFNWMLPKERNLAIGPRYDYGSHHQPLKAWLPAGTYRVVHYIFLSEINNSPSYLPCYGWWVKPPQVITLQPGQTIRFEPFSERDGTPMTSFNLGTCTGTPAAGAPPVVEQPPQQDPQPPVQPPPQQDPQPPVQPPPQQDPQPPQQPEQPPSTCTQEVELINNKYMGACGTSDTQTFELTQRVLVTRIRVWHNLDITGTDAPYVTITGPNGYNFSGNATKGDCYASWCEAMVALNQYLSPGIYQLSIPTASICTDPSGKTTLILYGCSASGQSSTFTGSCPAMTGVWNTTMTLRSSSNPDVPTGGTRQGVLTIRVEGDSAQVQWTEGGRSSQTSPGLCEAQGDRYQITLTKANYDLLPPQAPLPPPNAMVPLEEVLFPVTFDVRFESEDRLTGTCTVLSYNYTYTSDIVMSRQ